MKEMRDNDHISKNSFNESEKYTNPVPLGEKNMNEINNRKPLTSSHMSGYNFMGKNHSHTSTNSLNRRFSHKELSSGRKFNPQKPTSQRSDLQ